MTVVQNDATLSEKRRHGTGSSPKTAGSKSVNSRDIHGRWDFALVLQCGMVLFISVVRLSRTNIQFVLTSCEFGSVSKYSSVILEMSFLSLHQSADLYLNTLWGGFLFRIGLRFTSNVTAS